MHFLGVARMLRCIPDYPDAFIAYNRISSFVSYIFVLSAIFFFYVVVTALSEVNRVTTKIERVLNING